jgi:type II secretory pathway pseudopilin PulG
MIIVIIMLAALTSHLVMALQTSRENERELSKRLYNAVRNQRLKP